MSDTIKKRVGLGTAYGFAKAGGYEGTVEQFTELLGNIAIDLARIENLSVTVTTLPAGSQATASLNGSVLSLGIPKGDKGDKGNTGNTPDFDIGTVTTLSAGSSATASITGTAENPVLNLGIPEGQAGSGAVGTVASAYSSSSTYAVGDYVIHNSNLYRCTTAINTAEAFTAAHWTQVVLGDDVSDLKSDIASLGTDGTYIVDLTWEHGGIDNATGQNNNEGSTTRSRVAEYMKCSDYDHISSTDESQNAWVIYYDSDKVFIGSDSVVNGTAEIQQNYTFFRLDYRRGLEYTYNIKLYKYAESEKRITALEADAVTYDAVSDLFISTPDLEWEQGTLADASGIKGASTVRIRTVDFLKIQAKSTLSLTTNDSYIFQVYFWDESLIYQGTTSNLSNYSNQFENTTYVKVVLKNSNIELVIVPTEGNNLNATLIGFTSESDDEDENFIPSYWDSAVEEAEVSINDALASDERSASFGFVTDTHVGSNRGYSGALLKKVMSDCHIPVWFHGGDAVTGSAVITKDNLIAEMNADFEHYKAIENIGLRAIGNHEPAFGTSNYNYNLTNGEINQFYHGADREKYLQIYGKQKGYFYKDIHKDKLRCIMLDIVPYESQVNSSDLVTGSNKMWYHQFGSEQLEWFADVLANTPNGYSVVVCSHIAPVSLAELKTLDNSWSESVPIDYMQARKIAEAYALKSGYSFVGTIQGDTTGDSYNINVDFSSANGDFVCFFCGHTHKDFILALDNVKIIGTANDSINVSTNATDYAPSKTADTTTEQIIDFFCIKPTAREVSVVRLGAYLEANGKVRTFTY